MFTKTKIALAATLILGSASLALADDYTDQTADALRTPVAQSQQLNSREVALPQSRSGSSEKWMERASQTESGGGY